MCVCTCSEDDQLERIKRRVEVDENGCWIWQGARYHTGYGLMSQRGKNARTHRVAYAAAVGPIPAGLVLDHLCRNRACCNPDHLEPVTTAENLRRSAVATSTVNAAKTMCPEGHPYSDENTYTYSDGRRECRTCRQAGRKRWTEAH